MQMQPQQQHAAPAVRAHQLVDIDCSRRIVYHPQPVPASNMRVALTLNLMPHHFEHSGAMLFKDLRAGPRLMLAQKINEAALLIGNKPWDKVLRGCHRPDGQVTIEVLQTPAGTCAGYRVRVLTRQRMAPATLQKMLLKSLDKEARNAHERMDREAEKERRAAEKERIALEKDAEKQERMRDAARARKAKARKPAKRGRVPVAHRGGRPSDELREVLGDDEADAGDTGASSAEEDSGYDEEEEEEEPRGRKRSRSPSAGAPRKKRRLVMPEDEVPAVPAAGDEDPLSLPEVEDGVPQADDDGYGGVLSDAFAMHCYECQYVTLRRDKLSLPKKIEIYGKGVEMRTLPLYEFLHVDTPGALFRRVVLPYYTEHDTEALPTDPRAFANVAGGFQRADLAHLAANAFTVADGFVYNVDGYGINEDYLTPTSYYEDAYGPYPVDAMDLDADAAAGVVTTAAGRFAHLANEARDLMRPGARAPTTFPKGAHVFLVSRDFVLAEMLLERPLPVALGAYVGAAVASTYPRSLEQYAEINAERVARAIEDVHRPDLMRSERDIVSAQTARLAVYAGVHPGDVETDAEHAAVSRDLTAFTAGYEAAEQEDATTAAEGLIAIRRKNLPALVAYLRYRTRMTRDELDVRRGMYAHGEYPGHLRKAITGQDVAAVVEYEQFIRMLDQSAAAAAATAGDAPPATSLAPSRAPPRQNVTGMALLADEVAMLDPADHEARLLRALEMQPFAGGWANVYKEVLGRSTELEMRCINKGRHHLLAQKLHGRSEAEVAAAQLALQDEMGAEAVELFFESRNEMPQYLQQKDHVRRLVYGTNAMAMVGRREVPVIPAGPVVNNSPLQTCVTSMANTMSAVAAVSPINEKPTLKLILTGLTVYQTPENIGGAIRPNSINGGPPGTGKSYGIMAAGQFFLQGAMQNFNHLSTHSVNASENWYKVIYYCHEAQSSWLVNPEDLGGKPGGAGTDSTGVNFFKAILSEKLLMSKVLIMDKETKKRKTEELCSYFQTIFWFALNWNKALISKPLLDRFVSAEQPRVSENTLRAHPTSSLSQLGADKGRFVYECMRQKHLVMALYVLVEALFTMGVFRDEFYNESTRILDAQLVHVLRTEAKMAASTFAQRNLDHVSSVCRALSIYVRCFQLLAMPDGHAWLAQHQCSAFSYRAIRDFILPQCFADKEVYVFVVDMLLNTEDTADTLTALGHLLSVHDPSKQRSLAVARAEDMQGEPATKAALGLTGAPPAADAPPPLPLQQPNSLAQMMGRQAQHQAQLAQCDDHRYLTVYAVPSVLGEQVAKIMSDNIGYSVRSQAVVAMVEALRGQTIESPYYEKDAAGAFFRSMVLPDGSTPTESIACAVIKEQPNQPNRGRTVETMQIGIARAFLRTRMGRAMAEGDERELEREMLPLNATPDERARFRARLRKPPLERMRTAVYDESELTPALVRELSLCNRYENAVVNALCKVLQTDTLGMTRLWQHGTSLRTRTELERNFYMMLFSRVRDIYVNIRVPAPGASSGERVEQRLVVLSHFNRMLRLTPSTSNRVITYENSQRASYTMLRQLDAALVELDKDEQKRAHDIMTTSAIILDTDIDTHSHHAVALAQHHQESDYHRALKRDAGIPPHVLWSHPDAGAKIRTHLLKKRLREGVLPVIEEIDYPVQDILHEVHAARDLAREYNTHEYRQRRSLTDMTFTVAQQERMGLLRPALPLSPPPEQERENEHERAPLSRTLLRTSGHQQ